jgi:hypothetical protein
MFFNGSLYWLLNGMLVVLIATGLKNFAEDRGWTLNWWKWVLVGVWYLILSFSFYGWGTLAGENFPAPGFKLFLVGFFVSLILGVGLWRLLSAKPKTVAISEE